MKPYKQGNVWIAPSKTGAVLGKHKTKAKAEAQLRAVHANKAKAKK